MKGYFGYLGHFARPEIISEGHNVNWIAGAIKRPGAFTAKAKKAGQSVAGYAASVTKKGSRASTRTKRQANLAKTLTRLSRSK